MRTVEFFIILAPAKDNILRNCVTINPLDIYLRKSTFHDSAKFLIIFCSGGASYLSVLRGGLKEKNLSSLPKLFASSSVSGSLAPTVSGRKEVATVPDRQIRNRARYGYLANEQKIFRML